MVAPLLEPLPPPTESRSSPRPLRTAPSGSPPPPVTPDSSARAEAISAICTAERFFTLVPNSRWASTLVLR